MNPHPDSQPSGDWLFQHQGMLYGPVPAQLLLEKVESGELGADTPVARDGEAFRRIADEPVFAVQVARAVARFRVEGEARAAARARRNRRIAWIASLAVAALLLAGGAIRFVLWAEETNLFGPDEALLAALEIHVSLPVIQLAPVGAGGAKEEDEFHDYLEPEPTKQKAKRGTRVAAASTGSKAAKAEPDGLASDARYDQGAIQLVLAREQKSLYPCLQQQARSDPSFRGEVPLTFTIANDGRVGRIWIDRAGLEGSALEGCFRQKMASWRFPPFAGERPSVSLSFRVGS